MKRPWLFLINRCLLYHYLPTISNQYQRKPMPRTPKPITAPVKSTREILGGPNEILHSLYTQSQRLLDIEQTVKPFLPEDVAVAACQQGVLTLVTPSSSVATQLRYHQQQLIARLGQADRKLAIRSLKVLVRPHYPPPKVQTAPRRVISASNARQMVATAQHIDHEPLRNALLALSKRGDDQA